MADTLKNARQGGAVTTRPLKILIAARFTVTDPQRHQKLFAWFKPKTARAFAEESIVTIEELMVCIEKLGSAWWRH